MHMQTPLPSASASANDCASVHTSANDSPSASDADDAPGVNASAIGERQCQRPWLGASRPSANASRPWPNALAPNASVGDGHWQTVAQNV